MASAIPRSSRGGLVFVPRSACPNQNDATDSQSSHEADHRERSVCLLKVAEFGSIEREDRGKADHASAANALPQLIIAISVCRVGRSVNARQRERDNHQKNRHRTMFRMNPRNRQVVERDRECYDAASAMMKNPIIATVKARVSAFS